MGYLFTIFTDAAFPLKNYYVIGTSIESYFDPKGDMVVKVFDEKDMSIAVFRQVKAVTAINEDMLTPNEIRMMINPMPLMFETDKESKKAEVAPVQQENFWDTHDPSGGDLPPEDPKPELKNSIRRKKVDVGKVWALRKAGWTVPKICEEMKISPAYAFKICKEMKEKEEAKSEGVEGMRDLPQDL